jgi:hypothetical protein
MSVGVEQMFEGMPDPTDLRKINTDGRVVIMVGSRVVFTYDAADTGMQNIAVVTLTQLKFASKDVATVMGLSAVYVSRLRRRAREEGSAGLVRDRGRRKKLTSTQRAQARTLRDEGVSDVMIGQRFGVADTTVARALRSHPVPAGPVTEPGTLDLDLETDADSEPESEVESEVEPEPEPEPEPEVEPEPEPEVEPEPEPEVEPEAGFEVAGAGFGGERGSGAGRGSARIGAGVFSCRYAGAMLFHAFTDRVGAGAILTGPAGGAGPTQPLRFDDIALLTATSVMFGLGAATIEQVKHFSSSDAGPLCGLSRLPDLSTLRPRLAEIAGRFDPLALQTAFATAMLSADPCTSGVYYVDDHFVPYTGAKPVPKGWDTKHRVAQRGHGDTVIVDHGGRALVFTTGEPSGLSTTLPPALAQLREVTGPGAAIMLGFDRGGAYPAVFTACRAAGVHWITYRRAPLATTYGLPMAGHITDSRGRHRLLTYADEPVTLDGYGTARQITLFEHGVVVLQILTSDTGACPIALLRTLKSRWRIENVFKYAAEHYGLDTLGDYLATLETNTRLVDNPARKTANITVKTLTNDLATHQQALARLLADRALDITTLNSRLIAAQTRIATIQKTLNAAIQARKAIPAKLPANVIDPAAQRALLRTTHRTLQMVLRLLAYNSEHWLSAHLNAYLRDNHEYRAITRQTILRGLAGVITYTPTTITVDLKAPDSPKVRQALTCLLEEINTTPPCLPGDPRPITYTLNPST